MKRKTKQELEKLTKQHAELVKLIDDKNADSSKINSDLEKANKKVLDFETQLENLPKNLILINWNYKT